MKCFRRKTQLLQPGFFFGVVAVGLFLGLPALTLAVPGDLDPTFGNGGKVITQFGAYSFAFAADVAVQADGKIVVAGTFSFGGAGFFLARYHPNGSLDSSFGNGGKVFTFVRQFNYARAMVIQADGKIVVAGYAGEYGPIRDFAVLRYNTNGSLDTSFDGDGKVIIEMGEDSFANDLALQPDGKIIVAGASGTSERSRDFAFAIVRLNSDGTLDASFDGDGKVITSLGSFSDFGAAAVALQPDGKIVVVGQSGNGGFDSTNFSVVRYNADGSLDASFDGDGKVITAVSNFADDARDVAIQPDSKIVVVGRDSNGAAVVRYNVNGSLDASFGGQGIVLNDIDGYSSFNSVAIQSNGKIVAGGNALQFVVARYEPNGSLDTSFGVAGLVTTSFENPDYLYAYGGASGLTIQPDGKIIAAGSWGLDGEFAVLTVARYVGDAASPNVLADPQSFVRQHYRDFLNREPDASGLAFWTDNITKCSDPARRPAGQTEAECVDKQKENTSAAFFLSPEFQYTGYFVYRLFKGSLLQNGVGRFPSYQEFLRDVRQVASGIIQNNQLSAAAIEQNKKTFAEEFTKRAEFRSLYDPLSNFDYIERLFQTTGIDVSAAEKQVLVNGLNNQTETRASVLQKVVDGTVVISEGNQQFMTSYGRAFYEKEFNAAFVLMEYFGYLKRDPDAAGYQHWLDKLNLYGNYIEAEMVKSFITSPEYRSRFGQP